MTAQVYRQLEVRWIDLDPTRGAETKKKRPCVILQDDVVNQGSRTIIVAPLLPGHKTWPFAVNISPTTDNGLDQNRHINVKQLRAVDVSRITNRQGIIEKRYFAPIKHALTIVLNL